jgi:hypothetical protein
MRIAAANVSVSVLWMHMTPTGVVRMSEPFGAMFLPLSFQ